MDKSCSVNVYTSLISDIIPEHIEIVNPNWTLIEPKDIRQEDCAQVGVRRGAVVIFLFGLEALFTRGSRAQFCAVCSLPRKVGCHWLSCLSNQFLLAPREIKPVYYSILSTLWALGKSCLSTCRNLYSLAQSSYIMSLNWTRVCEASKFRGSLMTLLRDCHTPHALWCGTGRGF